MSDTRIITLNDGSQTIVDRENFYWLRMYKWQNTRGYAARIVYNPAPGTPKIEKMHRAILDRHGFKIKNLETDHINGNKLDNRISNLRLVTRQENSYNRGDFKNNTSGYKNVRWVEKQQKWRVDVGQGLTPEGKRRKIHGGTFENIHDAARKANELMIEYHGEFARLNIIKD